MSILGKAAYDYKVDKVHSKFEEYRNQNPELFCNQVIVNFFKQENNQNLLLGSIRGENDKKEALNESFRRYFFQIRFIAYITSSLQFMSIDQMRRNQRYATRNVLIYDKPSSDDSSVCIGEIKSTYQSSFDTAQPDEYSMFLKGNFTDEHVESAYQKLTDKQKHVTTLYYGFGYRDHEIATKLQVSQQAVAKTRNTALKKMKRTMLGEGS